MTDTKCADCVHRETCGLDKKHSDPDGHCNHFLKGDPIRARYEIDGFNQIAHKVIDLLNYEYHYERLKAQERDAKLKEIETIVHVAIGKITVLTGANN
jgi:hypothetical protein